MRTSDPRGGSEALDVFARIGRDHDLCLDEIDEASDPVSPARTLWDLYERHWRRFCGAHLDPQGWHLDHPAPVRGRIRVEPGAPVIVVGTGPSLLAQMDALARHRAGVYLVTSPRGAAVLAAARITPDLVLVEHQTALDAQFSVSDLAHRPATGPTEATLVGAQSCTPAALLRGVPDSRLFVPDPLPTWGRWPATAVAMAVLGGAGTVALLGVDLGRADAPDPQHAALIALLAWLARHAGVRTVDLGRGGAMKTGWPCTDIDAIALVPSVPPMRLEAGAHASRDERRLQVAAALDRLGPLVDVAAATLAAATAVRDTGGSAPVRTALIDGVQRLLAAGESRAMRVDVQDALGAALLPRFWRTRPLGALGRALWRPAAMACHELVQQHRLLRRRVEHGP